MFDIELPVIDVLNFAWKSEADYGMLSSKGF